MMKHPAIDFKKQVWIVLQAVARLLWLLMKEIFFLLQRIARYVYQHRVQIMQHKLTLPVLIVLSVCWTGLGVHSYIKDLSNSQTEPLTDEKSSATFQFTGLPAESYTNRKLILEIEEWIGTPHRDGQSSKEGTDCSGFVQAVFQETFDITLSRNSEEMYLNDAYEISRKHLQEGDLVFFNTYGNGISHVGIYLKNGKFVHTSTSRGVTIDSLNSPYYAQHYYSSARVKGIESDWF